MSDSPKYYKIPINPEDIRILRFGAIRYNTSPKKYYCKNINDSLLFALYNNYNSNEVYLTRNMILYLLYILNESLGSNTTCRIFTYAKLYEINKYLGEIFENLEKFRCELIKNTEKCKIINTFEIQFNRIEKAIFVDIIKSNNILSHFDMYSRQLSEIIRCKLLEEIDSPIIKLKLIHLDILSILFMLFMYDDINCRSNNFILPQMYYEAYYKYRAIVNRMNINCIKLIEVRNL